MVPETLSEPAAQLHWRNSVICTVLVAWSLAILWVAWKSGVQHDYETYLGQWHLVVDGEDPWATNNAFGTKNAYGPLHAAIGLLLRWGTLAPKMFMAGSLVLVNAALVSELLRERGQSLINGVLLLAVPTNFLFLGICVFYGLNDTFVAALVTASILLRHRDQFILAGLLLGLAALVKFYPILLLPFFAIEGRRLRWSLVACGIATFCFGLVAGVAIWGQGIVHAIQFGANRAPKLLSILASLSNTLGDEAVIDWLLRFNVLCVVAGVMTTFLIVYRAKISWLESATLGFVVLLLLYKAGNQQFYVPLLFMVASLPLLKKTSADRMAMSFIPLLIFLSVYQFGYEFATDAYHQRLGWVRLYGGFIAFPIAASCIAANLICFLGRDSRNPEDQLASV